MYCESLTSIPADLFANCPKVESFERTFEGCTNLTGIAPELWKRVPNGEEHEYRGTPRGKNCFYGCDKLSNYEEIPEYWKESIDE